LTLYLRIASDHFRKRLAEASNPDDLDKACDAIETIVRAENYLDSNVNVALTFQQLGASLVRRYSAV
jgi:hypothetical protein